MYTITVFNQQRNRVMWRVFPFYHQAKTWMLLNGFLDGHNLQTGEYVELKRRDIAC